MSNQFKNTNLQPLVDIMSALRDPVSGCPWDLKQTYKTVIPYTLEEAYEVAQAIEDGDYPELKLELGDLLFQVVFYAQLAKEDGLFEIQDVIDAVCEKLTRRHPHVFANQEFETEQAIKENWEREKAKERETKQARVKPSVLNDIPAALPALTRAYKIQKRCANVGFDWPNVSGALDKVKEEITELCDEIQKNEIEKASQELGDLMFAMVNVARHLGRDPESIMRQANTKFTNRFKQLEEIARSKNQNLNEMSLEQMDALWNEVKKKEI